MVAQVVTEHSECMHFVAWLTLKDLKFSHLAQSTYTSSWAAKRRNKELGVVSGVPDYMIITPKGLLFVEMKRLKRGVISEAQISWIDSLNKCDGVQAQVCKGFLEAKAFVEQFL